MIKEAKRRIFWPATRPYKSGNGGLYYKIDEHGKLIGRGLLSPIDYDESGNLHTCRKAIKPALRKRMKVTKYKNENEPTLWDRLFRGKKRLPLRYSGICLECGTTQINVPMVTMCEGCTKEIRERDDCFEEFWEKKND